MAVQTFYTRLPEGQAGPWAKFCPYMAYGVIEETQEPTFGCLASFLQVGEQLTAGRCQICPAAQGCEEEIAERAAYYQEHGEFPPDDL